MYIYTVFCEPPGANKRARSEGRVRNYGGAKYLPTARFADALLLVPFGDAEASAAW